MRKPVPEHLSPDLLATARAVGETLAAAGQRAWIVGGAVRDLALGLTPIEVEMCCAAPPEEVERLFARALPLGRNFGTLLVSAGGGEVELTTFRSETSYSDGRRPDSVHWGTSVEEDATRRDFTCNAMYLDPLSGDFLDPTGGWEDLEAGRLVTVGSADDRFREDGLRLLRLARLAAALDLAPTAAVLAGARVAAPALENVSRERVAQELERLLLGRAPQDGLRLLGQLGLIEHCLPDWVGGRAELLWRVIEELDLPSGALDRETLLALGFAVLLGGETPADAGPDLLDSLRPSRRRRRQVRDLWTGHAHLEELAGRPLARAQRLRLYRDENWSALMRLALAWRRARGQAERELLALAAEASALTPAELWPAPLLTARDLVAAGLQPGPAFGVLLEELEEAQLAGEVECRDQALAWLALRRGDMSGPGGG